MYTNIPYTLYILYRVRALEKANNFATTERQTQFPQTVFTAEFDIFGYYDRSDRDAKGMSRSGVGGDWVARGYFKPCFKVRQLCGLINDARFVCHTVCLFTSLTSLSFSLYECVYLSVSPSLSFSLSPCIAYSPLSQCLSVCRLLLGAKMRIAIYRRNVISTQFSTDWKATTSPSLPLSLLSPFLLFFFASFWLHVHAVAMEFAWFVYLDHEQSMKGHV